MRWSGNVNRLLEAVVLDILGTGTVCERGFFGRFIDCVPVPDRTARAGSVNRFLGVVILGVFGTGGDCDRRFLASSINVLLTLG